MRKLKNTSQLAGIACILVAAFTAWRTLPVGAAISASVGNLLSLEGTTSNTQIIEVARVMPMRLFESPWLLIGMTFVLAPYLASILAKFLESRAQAL
ncbi:MAG: hypothetical protein HY876_05770 [Coriobacteriales bacterium]|nr:hypothetical protein [Coriobacteriales bacterium]